MPLVEMGSTWKKWDLHVHTPESFVHHYPGEKEQAWQAFLADLAALPPEFKVIGINDYLFVDGYERVLREKRQGRLPNIDLVLPVIEFRMDKFGGILEQGPDGHYLPSSWTRINLHVIFDQVDPALIREQFMPALSRRYALVPGAAGHWGGVITRENLIALGEAVIASMPAAARPNAPPPLKAGFGNLNVSYDGLKEALNNPHLNGKYLVAVGKTEWDNLRWNDNNIAEKKTVINDADLVFTASENPEAYARARAALKAANVNARLLDCSDAHSLSQSAAKDRIGNCFTWIKADSSFSGLLQAIEEFDARVYVGDDPEKRALVAQNRTKFISAVKIQKKEGSTLPETWFNATIPLNPDLVAIIGNKGSGKSALSDILALAGGAKNHAAFSFLTVARFRNPKARLAQHFSGTLVWHDGGETSRDLDKDPEPSSVERVKYLPQSYLEQLCNELGERGSDTFDAELRKIIYSHVPVEDRLGKSSMDELLEFKVAEIDRARKALRDEIAQVNASIVAAENRLTPEFRRGLDEQLAARKAELASLELGKPQAVEDPSNSADAMEESKLAAASIELLEQRLKAVHDEEAGLKDRKAAALKREALARRVSQAMSNQRIQHNAFLEELRPLVAELGEVALDELVQFTIDAAPLNKIQRAMQDEVKRVDDQLQSNKDDGLAKRRETLVASISEARGKLGDRQRQYIRYKEELSKWERTKLEIQGAADKPQSIAGLVSQIEALNQLPAHVAELKERRAAVAKEIHARIQETVNEYQRLYGPVQTFVQSAEQMDMDLPLEFQVRIEETDFEENFFSRLNRQIRGTFSGVEEGSQRLQAMLQEANFAAPDDAVAFAVQVDQSLRVDQRDGQLGREARLSDQLRKGVDSANMLDYLFGLEYLTPRYSLTYAGQEIGQLSPGERGLLLLVFYLLVDKDDIPIVIDQPEENLDNQTIYKILVKCVKKAKERRQVIMVTHNPNLAVVCDAEQIVYASCDKLNAKFDYESGAIENPNIRARVVAILEGTAPAFKNRQSKYRLQ